MPSKGARVALLMLYVVGAVIFATPFGTMSHFASPLVGALVGLLVWTAALTFLVVSLLFALAVHELGHYLMVRNQGWKFLGVQVAFLQVEQVGGRLRFAWAWDAKDLGLVRFAPVNATVRGGALIAAAGPAFSLVGFLVLYGLSARLGPSAIAGHGWRETWAWVFKCEAFLSLILGASSLVPSTTGSGRSTDGLQMWQSWRHRKSFGAMLDIVELSGLLASTRVRDLPADRLEARKSDATYLAFLYLVRYWKALDAGNIPLARAELEIAWEHVGALQSLRAQQAALAFEVAMFFTRFVDDRELRDKAYGFGLAANPDSMNRLSADAARLFVEGSVAEAMSLLDDKLSKMEADPDQPQHMKDHVRDWNERILDRTIPVRGSEEPAQDPPAKPEGPNAPGS